MRAFEPKLVGERGRRQHTLYTWCTAVMLLRRLDDKPFFNDTFGSPLERQDTSHRSHSLRHAAKVRARCCLCERKLYESSIFGKRNLQFRIGHKNLGVEHLPLSSLSEMFSSGPVGVNKQRTQTWLKPWHAPNSTRSFYGGQVV